MNISIEVMVNAPLSTVWRAWTSPTDITHWNFASDDWCCPSADIELTVGGTFTYRMEAKDGSMGFDFTGEFTAIEPSSAIEFILEDGRTVTVRFIESATGTQVIETFDAENIHTGEEQRQGWLSILNNFKKHAESL
jgi:uncharacterized protein YndB with AHSA1/START domain